MCLMLFCYLFLSKSCIICCTITFPGIVPGVALGRNLGTRYPKLEIFDVLFKNMCLLTEIGYNIFIQGHGNYIEVA